MLQRAGWVAVNLVNTIIMLSIGSFCFAPRVFASLPSNLTPDRSAFEAFADAFIPRAMAGRDIPGAAFVAVYGDEVIVKRAFGDADISRRVPVTVDRTLFRVASISKIPTALCVLQEVEARRLRLHEDVNDYLRRMEIAPAFGAHLTLFDLLTHSSGFDVNPLHYAARSEAEKLALGDYLAQFQPERLRPPGLFSAYDNYGYALAGYLAQEASGLSFEECAQRLVFEPLRMRHSYFSVEAIPRGSEMATGYWLKGSRLQACSGSFVNITPAAGMWTTADDMSHLLVALVANRNPDGGAAFSGRVLKRLLQQQFAFDPAVPGRTLGFDVLTIGGCRVLRQTGEWPGFNAVLLLIPDRQIGTFLVYNRWDKLRMGRDFCRNFIRSFCRIAPSLKQAPPLQRLSKGVFRAVAGSYLTLHYSQEMPHLGLAKALEVARGNRGELTINGQSYRAIDQFVFERVDSSGQAGVPVGRRVAFRIGPDGTAQDLISETGAYRRAGWMETRRGRIWLMRSVTLVLVSVLVTWPVVWLAGGGFGSHAGTRKRLPGFYCAARGVLLAACVLGLGFECWLGVTLGELAPFAELYGAPSSVRHVLLLLPVLCVAALVLTVTAFELWRRRVDTIAYRIHFTLVPVALGVLIYLYHLQGLFVILALR